MKGLKQVFCLDNELLPITLYTQETEDHANIQWSNYSIQSGRLIFEQSVPSFTNSGLDISISGLNNFPVPYTGKITLWDFYNGKYVITFKDGIVTNVKH